MKIICAGASRTGTKSLHEALSELGYTVYDFMDHFWEHEQHWKKIFEEGGTIEDFKMMYENVDVALDAPVFPFWEEISQAFPDAKVNTKLIFLFICILMKFKKRQCWLSGLITNFAKSFICSMWLIEKVIRCTTKLFKLEFKNFENLFKNFNNDRFAV